MTEKNAVLTRIWGIIFISVLLFIFFFALSRTVDAAVGINPQIPFSGVLNDTRGRPVNGARDMVFRIYDASSGGNVLWEGEYTTANGNAVQFDDGSFTVMLGSGTGNAINLDFNSDTYYLGVTVGSDSEMTPRERMGAIGYAFNANLLDGLDATAFAKRADAVSFATATSGTLLAVQQTGVGDIFTLSNTSSEVFTVLENGNVGIGSTTPTSAFTVGGNAYFGGNIRGTGTLTLSALTSGVLLTDGNGVVSSTTSIPMSYLNTDILTTTEVDSLFELETLTGVSNILIGTDIDTSSEFMNLINDETGTGTVVFSNAPTLTNPTIVCTDCITDAQVSDTLTASTLSSMIVSQFTNDSGYITDGNTGWDNTYGFWSSTTDGVGSGLDADLLDGNTSADFYRSTNPSSYISDGNTLWDNSYGFITDDTVVPKNHFENSGTLGFVWTDAEISNDITATSVPALGITGTALPSTIVSSSLTSLATISTGVWEGTAISPTFLDSSVILAGELDTLLKIETLAGVTNIIVEDDINTSAKFAGLVTDETGDGSLVFSNSPTISGTATFGIVQATGTLTAFNFENTQDTANNFAGSLVVTSGDASSFGGDIEIADGSGLALAGGNGVRIYQDGSSSGANDVVFELVGDAVDNEYANITSSHALWLTPNNSDNCNTGCEPSLVLDTTGKASLYNTGYGNAEDRLFEINFTSGVSIPSGDLVVANTIQSSELGGGGIIALSADNDGNIIPETSDGRLKKNVTTIDDALDIVLDLRGVRYQWIDAERFGSSTEIGFIAQELQQEIPEVVRDTGEYLSVNSKNITAVLVEAIKEMYGEMQEYFTRTESLEREVETLRREIELLKNASNRSSDTQDSPDEETVSSVDAEDGVATEEVEAVQSSDEEVTESTEVSPEVVEEIIE